jgi:hypothetical protein
MINEIADNSLSSNCVVTTTDRFHPFSLLK